MQLRKLGKKSHLKIWALEITGYPSRDTFLNILSAHKN